MATNKEELEKKKVEQPKLNGVDDATQNKMNSSFTASTNQQNAQNKANEGLSRVEDVTSKKDIVSGSVMNTLNSSFKKPTAVVQADAWINNQLGIIQSGKTSFSDQVKDMMSQIQNREKFSYDVDTDPLFQQALASSMNSGKQAMQDTIGQASALTGGYGSTYATTAGNQAYNSFIEDAYDNLPQYYQMAMEAYQMEGDELYRQLGMLTDADDREYSRNVTAYDATYQHRNQMYNEAYQQFRDKKTDAYNMANLQLNIHGQQVSDAVNYYNATSDYADTMYNREYNSWLDTVNQAFKNAEMLNSEYWNQTNFDEGVRQYEKNFTEEQRQFDKSYEQNDRHHSDEMTYKNNALAQDQAQFESTQAFNDKWNQKDDDYRYAALDQDDRHHNAEMGYKYDALAQDQSQFESTQAFNDKWNQKDLDYKYANMDSKGGNGGNGGDKELKNPTETQNKKALEAYNTEGMEGLNKYLNSIPGEYDTDAIAAYVGQYGELPLEQRTFTKTKDTTNWLWGVDNNDTVKDQYGNEYHIDQLPKSVQKELTKLKEGESYTKK